MKTQIIIAILLFAAPFLISPKVAQAAEKATCCVSMEDKDKKENTKTECCANKTASTEAKKECCKNAEKKGCAETQSSSAKSAECAKKDANCPQSKKECPKSKENK
ncbi:MAG: hypothetical protein KA807_08785 [Prolixibacteraceae bacterium]|nr:hypothetical protein [Prolixibacteraceae bacterium]